MVSQAAIAAQKVREPFWDTTFHDPIATFTFFLLVATVLLAISTGLLWWTTRRIAIDGKRSGDSQADKMERSAAAAARSAEAMEQVAGSMAVNASSVVQSVAFQRRYAQMQLRPYLTVLVGQGVWQDASNVFEVRPKVLNTGQTPAKDVRWRIATDIVELDAFDQLRFPLPPEEVGGNMISPHQDYQLSALLPYRVDDADVDQIRFGRGTKTLVVWGYISYRDGLRRRYLTTFAHRFWWDPTFDQEGNLTAVNPRALYLYKHNRTN